MVEEKKKWDGIPRRCDDCVEHSAHSQRMDSTNARVAAIEVSDPVPYKNFLISLGIVVTAVLSLFGISIYKVFDSEDTLHSIHIEQVKTTEKLNSVDKRLENWNAIQHTRITAIEKDLSSRKELMREITSKLHVH